MREYLEGGCSAIRRNYVRRLGHTLFVANKARAATVANQEIEAACTRLGIPSITTHGFRLSLGIHLLRRGVDMRHIQATLGHEALSTTQFYTLVLARPFFPPCLPVLPHFVVDDAGAIEKSALSIRALGQHAETDACDISSRIPGIRR